MMLYEYSRFGYIAITNVGMEESDMDRCDVMLGIPTNPVFGSLNLAAAVQLIAYDWRMAVGGHGSYDTIC